MMNRLLTLGLAMSLLFNLFFAVGYLKAKRAVELAPPEVTTVTASDVGQRLVQELDLDEQQVAAYEALRGGLEQEQETYRERLALVQSQLQSELGNSKVDFLRMGQLIEEQTEAAFEMRRAASRQFQTFVAMLTPEQRERVGRVMQRSDRGPRSSRDRDRMRFDENHDGRLDEAEQKAFDEARAARNKERLREVLERYDANGNGELDEDERARAEQDWKERRETQRRETLRQFDTNGDGRIDDEERGATHDRFRDGRRRGMRDGRSRDGGRPDGPRRRGPERDGRPAPPDDPA
jgi:Ca2+-binding EF-hand superfamily protein